MKRVKLVIAYDGTNYHGWQMQPNGLSIEAVLNKALSSLLKENIAVIGASRTDSGVHALGNVAVFDTENRMPAEKICFALNQRLPEDIRIQSSCEVPLNWHPRKQNAKKTYEYKILNRKIDMPVGRLYTYFCYFPVDVEAMRKAASSLIGEHDFKSFCTVRTQAEETVRTIYSLDIERGQDDVVTIRITGSGFLYNMVRIIAGTLLRVGTGLYAPEHVEEILDARNRQAAGPTLPAKGLTLVRLDYETELERVMNRRNKHWAYQLIQAEVLEKKKAYLIIHHCERDEFDRLLTRVAHQAVRNGARWVFACDKEADDRLVPGKAYGYYVFRFAHEMLEMRKAVGQETGEAKSVPGQEGKEAAGMNEAGVKKVQETAEMNEAEFKKVQETAELEKLQKDADSAEISAFCRGLNETFYAVPNSETLNDEEVRKWLTDEKQHLYWIEVLGTRAGVLVLQERKDGLMVDSIGVFEDYRRQGIAGRVLASCEALAAEWGKTELILQVSDANTAAYSLYKAAGFSVKRTISRWFVTEGQQKGEEG